MTESKTGRTQGMVSEGVLQGSREGPRLLQPWGEGPPGAGGPGSEWEVAAGLGVCEAFGGLGALDPRFLVFTSSAQGQHKGGPWEVLRPRADFVRGRQRLGQSKKRLARRVSADHQPPLHASSGGRALSPEATLCSLKVRPLGQFLISGRLPSLALGPGDLEVDKTWSTPPSLLRRARNHGERE